MKELIEGMVSELSALGREDLVADGLRILGEMQVVEAAVNLQPTPAAAAVLKIKILELQDRTLQLLKDALEAGIQTLEPTN